MIVVEFIAMWIKYLAYYKDISLYVRGLALCEDSLTESLLCHAFASSLAITVLKEHVPSIVTYNKSAYIGGEGTVVKYGLNLLTVRRMEQFNNSENNKAIIGNKM